MDGRIGTRKNQKKEKEKMATIYLMDTAHSTASFSIKHMMIAKVHGEFEKLNGKLTLFLPLI